MNLFVELKLLLNLCRRMQIKRCKVWTFMPQFMFITVTHCGVVLLTVYSMIGWYGDGMVTHDKPFRRNISKYDKFPFQCLLKLRS